MVRSKIRVVLCGTAKTPGKLLKVPSGAFREFDGIYTFSFLKSCSLIFVHVASSWDTMIINKKNSKTIMFLTVILMKETLQRKRIDCAKKQNSDPRNLLQNAVGSSTGLIFGGVPMFLTVEPRKTG